MSDWISERIPRKYVGYVLIICGILFIIISLINLPWFPGLFIFLVLGQSCLLIGIAGIYYRKTKNYEPVRVSKDKDRIERFLLQKNVLNLITIIGIIFTTLYYIIVIFGSDLNAYYIMKLPGVLFMMIFGYFFLICGLLVVIYNKKIASKF